ncbi:MAG: sigma 54-dependent Fis family transcriptional regulator [Deltaproteobacteria bacterium]|nr:sigma 54-dependent Fis family transcriptional regulator [Deltaproteobacteria bacterium]
MHETIVSGTQVRRDGERATLVMHRLRLRVTGGADKGKECDVEAARVTIGAAQGNDLVLTDRQVSRHHCEVLFRDGRFLLRDLGSTNGTFVGDVKVVELEIAPGARVRLGRTEITFEPKKRFVRLKESEGDSFGAMLGCSAAMRAVFGLLERIARTRLSCLIVGETGTGKELAARALHEASDRASGPFVVVDCGAVTASLVESEMFGHEKGAFTGADRARAGAFQLAHGGTVFLDEIGELPIDLQPKLLRVLERREVKPVGGSALSEVDVRVVCATHRSLEQMVAEGTFREDLYYRIAEVAVEIPPLRRRPEDTALLATKMVEQEARNGGRVTSIAPDAITALSARDWPGNARELRNVMRRSLALAKGEVLHASDLEIAAPSRPRRAESVGAPPDLPYDRPLPTLKDARDQWVSMLERQYLERVMQVSEGDYDKAAAVAGLHRKSLRRLLREHGMMTDDDAGGGVGASQE